MSKHGRRAGMCHPVELSTLVLRDLSRKYSCWKKYDRFLILLMGFILYIKGETRNRD